MKFKDILDRVRSKFFSRPVIPSAQFLTATTFFGRGMGAEPAEVNYPYHTTAPFFSGVKLIADSVGLIPFVIWKDREKLVREDGPIQKLFDEPCPLFTSFEFWKLLATYLKSDGGYFVYLESGRAGMLRKGQLPRELWPLSPNDVTIEFEDDWTIKQFVYQAQGSEAKLEIPPHAMIFQREIDPHHPYSGLLSSALPAGTNINVEGLSARQQMAILQNGGVPDGILTTDGRLTQSQAKRASEQWEDRHRGADRAGRIAVLEGGLKYQVIQATSQDFPMHQSSMYARDSVFMSLGVQSSMLLPGDTNLATLRETKRSFYEQTIMPILVSMQDQFNRGIIKDHDAVGLFDTSDIPALQPSLTERLAQAKDLRLLGYPLNQINARLDLEMPILEKDIGDVSIIQANLATTEEILMRIEEPEEPEMANPDGESGPIPQDPGELERDPDGRDGEQEVTPNQEPGKRSIFPESKLRRRLFEFRSRKLAGESDSFEVLKAAIEEDARRAGVSLNSVELDKLVDFLSTAVQNAPEEELKFVLNQLGKATSQLARGISA